MLPWQRNLGYFAKKNQIASSLLFHDGVEPSFGRQFSMTPYTKSCSSILDLGPLTPKIDSPKFAKKSPITRLVTYMTDRPEMFASNRGFSGWPIQWNHTKCCGADPCCHGNELWARRGVQSPTGLFYIHLYSPRVVETVVLCFRLSRRCPSSSSSSRSCRSASRRTLTCESRRSETSRCRPGSRSYAAATAVT